MLNTFVNNSSHSALVILFLQVRFRPQAVESTQVFVGLQLTGMCKNLLTDTQ